MNDEVFTELMVSVREGAAIMRGEKEPSREFVVEGPNVMRIRERRHLTQSEFATLLEIGHRKGIEVTV